MRLLVFACCAASSMLGGCYARADAQRLTLFSTHFADKPTTERASITINSDVPLGRVDILVARVTNGVTVVVSDSDMTIAHAALSSSRFPDLDISTLEISEVEEESLIAIEMSYGTPRVQCYDNYDGRDKLRLYVDTSGLRRAVVQLFEGCVSSALGIDLEELR